jgi:hypothetical protein
MATRTAVAGDGIRWKAIGAILGVITILHILDGKKVSLLDAGGAHRPLATDRAAACELSSFPRSQRYLEPHSERASFSQSQEYPKQEAPCG